MHDRRFPFIYMLHRNPNGFLIKHFHMVHSVLSCKSMQQDYYGWGAKNNEFESIWACFKEKDQKTKRNKHSHFHYLNLLVFSKLTLTCKMPSRTIWFVKWKRKALNDACLNGTCLLSSIFVQQQMNEIWKNSWLQLHIHNNNHLLLLWVATQSVLTIISKAPSVYSLHKYTQNN